MTARCAARRRYVQGPRCVFPIGADCEDSKPAAETSSVKEGSRKSPKSRKLGADTGRGIMPYRSTDTSRRRLITRGEAYADLSKCMAASFDLIPETSKQLVDFRTVLMIGPVPVTITVEVFLVMEMGMTVTICIADKTGIVTIVPKIKLEAALFGGLAIPVARAGLEVDVTVLDTTFTPSASISYKNGMDMCLALDIAIVPIAIKLSGVLEFFGCPKFCKVRTGPRTPRAGDCCTLHVRGG